jgi:hypothetical protein
MADQQRSDSPAVTDGRIIRRRTFAQVPDALVVDHRVSHVALRLWIRLDRYAGADGQAYPSRERLAADLAVSLGTIKRSLSLLVETGWITRKQRSATVWDTYLNEYVAAHR